jgi:general secretion pathway protein N
VKRWFGLSFLFIVVFSASAIVHLPATFVVQHMPAVKGLTLQGITGTLWQGSAKEVSFQLNRNAPLHIGEVTWQLNLSQWLSGNAMLDVRFGRNGQLGLKGKGVVGYGLDGPFAENLVLSMPAEKIVPWIPSPLPVVASGQVEVSIQEYHYAAPYCATAVGDIVWNSAAASTAFGGLELGQVIAQFSCQDNQITASGSQQTEQVSSQFDVEVGSNNQFSSSAWFKAEQAFPDNLRSQLKWLGNPDSQQRYRFNYSGKLPKI